MQSVTEMPSQERLVLQFEVDHFFNKSVLPEIQKRVSPDQTILNIGAGVGMEARTMAKAGYKKQILADINLYYLKLAKHRFPMLVDISPNLRANFELLALFLSEPKIFRRWNESAFNNKLQTDAVNMCFADCSMGGVLMKDLLIPIIPTERQLIVQEAYRVLEPGRWIFIQSEINDPKRPIYRDNPPLRPEDATSLLVSSGFRLEGIEVQTYERANSKWRFMETDQMLVMAQKPC